MLSMVEEINLWSAVREFSGILWKDQLWEDLPWEKLFFFEKTFSPFLRGVLTFEEKPLWSSVRWPWILLWEGVLGKYLLPRCENIFLSSLRTLFGLLRQRFIVLILRRSCILLWNTLWSSFQRPSTLIWADIFCYSVGRHFALLWKNLLDFLENTFC